MISPEEFKRITDEVCKKEEIKEQKITEKVVKKALKIISKELKKQAKDGSGSCVIRSKFLNKKIFHYNHHSHFYAVFEAAKDFLTKVGYKVETYEGVFYDNYRIIISY